MRRTGRWWMALVLCAAVNGWAAYAGFEEAYKAGEAARRAGDSSAAIRCFTEAYKLSGTGKE